MDDNDDDGMPNLANMPTIEDEFMNSLISIEYVPNWGLKEALREYIQNSLDAMAEFMIKNKGSKSEWKVRIKEYKYNNDKKYRTFEFYWPKHDIILGKFNYDPNKQELVIENPGSVKRYNLLLGGSGKIKKQKNEEIIGHFGEGMKLGALALLRENIVKGNSEDSKIDGNENDSMNRKFKRSLVIDTDKERWIFTLANDPKFNDETCLFYKISKLSENKMKSLNLRDKYTYTRVGGLTIDEWNEQYKYYLALCQKSEMRMIHTTKECEYQESILLDHSMKGQLFIKGMHVQQYKTYEYDSKDNTKTNHNFALQDDSGAMFYGYDLSDVETNRDRMAVVSVDERGRHTSGAIANILNNFEQLIDDDEYCDCRDELHEMWEIVYYSIKHQKQEVYNIDDKLSTSSCNRLWQEWIKDKTYFNKMPENIVEYMPIQSYNQSAIETFLKSRLLGKEFYLYKTVPYRLYYCLSKSENFESYERRFDKLQSDAKGYDYTQNEKHLKTVNVIIKNVKEMMPDFNKNQIVFKGKPITEKTSYVSEIDNKLYISKDLLENEWKLLAKCFELLKIEMEDVLKHYAESGMVDVD